MFGSKSTVGKDRRWGGLAPVAGRVRELWYPIGVGGLALAVVAVGATGLRRSLWTDEAFTAIAVARPFAETAVLVTRVDGGLAGYLLLMNVWVGWFGTSEVALRLPSLAASAVTVVAAATLGRRVAAPLVGERLVLARSAGLTAALLVAVHYKLIGNYAIEARPYALATASITCCAVFWQKAAHRPSVTSVWLGAGCAAFALTQHVLLAAIAILCLVPWFIRARAGLTGPARLGANLAAAGVVLVAGLMGLALVATRIDGWLLRPDLWETVGIAASLVGPTGLMVLGLIIVAVAVGSVRRRRLRPAVRRALGDLRHGDIAVLLLWATGPFLLLWACSLVVEPILVGRYILSSVVAIEVLLAVVVIRIAAAVSLPSERLRPTAGQRGAVAAAVVLVAVVGFGTNLQRASGPEEDLRAASAHVLAAAQTGDAVVYTPTWREGPFRWYLEERAAGAGRAPELLGAIPDATARSAVALWTPMQATAVPATLLAGPRRVWVVGKPNSNDSWEPIPNIGDAVHRELTMGWSQREHVTVVGDISVELWSRN